MLETLTLHDFKRFQATGNIMWGNLAFYYIGVEKQQARFFYIQKFSPWLPPKVKRGVHQIHHSNLIIFFFLIGN